jgi:hypothetical protein
MRAFYFILFLFLFVLFLHLKVIGKNDKDDGAPGLRRPGTKFCCRIARNARNAKERNRNKEKRK